MKTYKQITNISVNDYAFFKGVSTTEAKWEFGMIIYGDADKIPLTKSESPSVSPSELLSKDNFDFTMRSNSALDGLNQMEYLCDFYNKGLPKSKLKDYAYKKSFVSALKPTGKDSIIKDILNSDQYRVLEESWLLENCYMKTRFSDNCLKFIIKTDWAIDYLTKNGVNVNIVNEKVLEFKENIKSK